jgi:hypothetical protein
MTSKGLHVRYWPKADIPSCVAHVRFWPKAGMPKNAIDVAIGGKADMAYCTAFVCF